MFTDCASPVSRRAGETTKRRAKKKEIARRKLPEDVPLFMLVMIPDLFSICSKWSEITATHVRRNDS